MAISAWGNNLVAVPANVRTKIGMGPLVHGLPVQWVVFERRGVPNAPISYRLVVYSAAAPWYLTTSGIGTVWNSFTASGMPWDLGVPLWLLASPWAEVHVTTNVSCLASVNMV